MAAGADALTPITTLSPRAHVAAIILPPPTGHVCVRAATNTHLSLCFCPTKKRDPLCYFFVPLVHSSPGRGCEGVSGAASAPPRFTIPGRREVEEGA